MLSIRYHANYRILACVATRQHKGLSVNLKLGTLIGFATLSALAISLSGSQTASSQLSDSNQQSAEGAFAQSVAEDGKQANDLKEAVGEPPLSPEALKQASLAAFAKVATVLRHPRCLNCHPSGDRPHVGDDRRLHGMNVQRGPKNHGMAGLHCGACHRTENQEVPNIPGTPHWQLAPRSMGWEGLDDHELATMLMDKKRNGNRSLDDLVHHMENDPLVLWGWEPGEGRSVPPVSHHEFIRALKKWFATGAAIPNQGETTF